MKTISLSSITFIVLTLGTASALAESLLKDCVLKIENKAVMTLNASTIVATDPINSKETTKIRFYGAVNPKSMQGDDGPLKKGTDIITTNKSGKKLVAVTTAEVSAYDYRTLEKGLKFILFEGEVSATCIDPESQVESAFARKIAASSKKYRDFKSMIDRFKLEKRSFFTKNVEGYSEYGLYDDWSDSGSSPDRLCLIFLKDDLVAFVHSRELTLNGFETTKPADAPHSVSVLKSALPTVKAFFSSEIFLNRLRAD